MRNILLGILLSAMASCCHFSNSSPLKDVNKTTGKIVLMQVTPKGDIPLGGGSGFSIGEHTILTANHVCSLLSMIPDSYLTLYFHNGYNEVQTNNRLIVIKNDPHKDLCLLYIHDNPLRTLKLSRKWPTINDEVFVFGAPAHEAYLLTSGFYGETKSIEIGGVGRVFVAALSAPAYGGNSGGPVLNSDGDFIGVLIAGYTKYSHITYTPSFLDLKEFLEK